MYKMSIDFLIHKWYTIVKRWGKNISKKGIKIMSKEIIAKLNTIAKEDFTKAEIMLEGINLALGTEYGWLNKRVVFFDHSNNSHDAYVYFS